jgi:hypothetical protein
MKSALFVDFDNIYSGLRQLDQATADRFARRPMEWVSWMVNAMALPEHVTGDSKRRILVRRCYLNPQVYQHFRPYFNLAGFEITDCPALTSAGKTSTDIHMVLDIVDLLQHEAHYDEFIVLSADADFTPVLRKLRRWDRRTTVLAIGFPSAAYRASADLVIDQDAFVREALGMAKQAADSAPSHDQAPAALPARTSALEADGSGVDTSRVGTPGVAMSGIDKPGVDTSGVDAVALADLVRREVRQSGEPLSCARLAASIARHVGATPADWYGKGSFRRFLESLDLAPLQFDWKIAGGIIFDPDRHLRPTAGGAPVNLDWSGDPATLAFARQINEVAGVPLLPPARFQALFAMLSTDLADHGYQLLETAKRVRDRCRDAGHPVSRADVDFVLRGLIFRGHRFEEHTNAAPDLATKFANNVRSLCLREQIVLDGPTETMIRNWIG